HQSPAEIGPVDWVVCGLKATAVEDARALLAPCVGEGMRILLLLNGLGLEETFAGWFGAERIFGGLAFTCINRLEPGVIHHMHCSAVNLAHGRDVSAEQSDARTLWDGAKATVLTAPSLLAAR